MKKCDRCKGKGTIPKPILPHVMYPPIVFPVPIHVEWEEVKCPKCDGKGYVR